MENQEQSNSSNNGFVPPRHWIGLQELDPSYWADEKAMERRGQEFQDKPIETIAMIEKMDSKGIARRDFLTIMGASMAMASFACARRPVHKIIPYVVKPEEITPGVANYYASTCPDTGEGLLVKTREGRPIKLEGNPDHPLNRGALQATTQASILDLYDPERLQEPVARGRGAGGQKATSWADADAAIAAKLKAAGRVRVLSGEVLSDSTRRLITEFLGAFSSGAHVEFDPLYLEEVGEGQAESYGTALVPRYRVEDAEVILSLGSDFLGTDPNATENNIGWAKGRRPDAKNPAKTRFSKMICFEPMMSLTGANADERYTVRPGDELKVALALAHEMIVVQKHSRYAGDGAVSSALSGYGVDAVSADTGVPVEKLRAVANALWGARGKGLVLAGSLQSRTRDSLALQIAANFLNSALENEGATVDASTSPDLRPRAGFAAVEKLIKEMNGGAVDVLIVYRSNPLYNLPKSAGFEDALKKVPFVVAVSDRMDESSEMADYVLPDHHYLENWGDAHPRKGIYSLQQPVLAPIFSTRAFQDSLLAWIKAGSLRASGIAARHDNWHDYLMTNWRETVFRENGSGSFETFWENSLRDGVVKNSAVQNYLTARATPRSFRTSALARLPKFEAGQQGTTLALYASNALRDGRQANNAWLQEMPDPVSTVTWDNFLNVGPALAQKLGVKQDDVVEVSADGVSVELPVVVQPGMPANSVSAAIGYGRRAVGKVGNGTGVDLTPFIKTEGGRLVYSGMAVQLKKTGKVYRLAATQWHNVSENRPIINDITLAEFKKDPKAANHTDPHLRMEEVPTLWPLHEYKGYRWGMAIDLNACTGCGACVIACQAENNIPVVGRNNVRVSREMHWIRIDRYYSGDAENPSVVFQPMLCQHCENAPCETVCPVLATVHDDEGLNEQVYNRCVGTRYCQNNCPYKVRRFNFFDHWKSYEGTMNLVWNPEVTVRSRGIMEKCTFCVQRIRDAKDQAKDKGVQVGDGDLKTACQQTCPTNAIVFGDINNPESQVTKEREDARAFRVLEVLNTKPSISYLTKVRNREAGESHHGEHHS